MKNKMRTHKLYSALLTAVILTLLIAAIVLADGSIDNINKWAWGSNIGWVNLNPTNGGVTVYSDHLEGFAWGESVGWIRMGTCATAVCTHDNSTNTHYGVNNDGVGNLSGYAWGSNIGWINFSPNGISQVWVDPVTGDFHGEAWGENVGWIRFKDTAVNNYLSNSNWRGNLLAATYENDIAAIITTHRTIPASSAGLTIANGSFLQESGDGIILGHNNADFHAGIVSPDLNSSNADKRWARIWQFDVNDEDNNGGSVTLTFDISEAGGVDNAATNFDAGGTYFLLKRAAGTTDDFTDVTPVTWAVVGDQLTFTVNANLLGSEFTVGADTSSPTAVSIQSFDTASNSTPALAILLVTLILAMTGGVILRRRA